MRTVQRLLAESAGRYGDVQPVKDDGDCGEKTLAAIELFQRNAVGIANPDGRVDPNGRTLRVLNTFAEHVPAGAGPEGAVVRDVSEAGLKLIGRFEGCILKLYDDPVGYATIGYGHLVHKGRVGTNPTAEAPFAGGLTDAGALALLKEDAAIHVEGVNACVRVPLLQHQFDALTSLSFNIGTNALRNSTLVRIVNKGGASPNQIRDAFCLWKKAGGRINQGLLGRRHTEAAVYNGGAY